MTSCGASPRATSAASVPGRRFRPRLSSTRRSCAWPPSAPRDFNGRTHFLAIAALSMRQILVQRARARRALKRGGAPAACHARRCPRGARQDSARFAPPTGRPNDIDLLALDEALTQLAELDADARPHRRTALLRRPDRRGDRRSPRRLARHGQAAVGAGARVAETRARRRRAERTRPP